MGTATSGERAASVSVLVPAYDVEGYLPEALGSVPVRAGVQVIVVDDGSSDGTADVAEAALEGHPDARVIRAPHRGAGAARNLALAEATGEWVLFLDADDRLADGALEALLGAATSEPDIDVVVADLRRFPAGVGKERFTWQRIFEHAPVTIDDAADLEHLVYAAGPANKLFRRAAVERVGARFGDIGAFEDGFFTIPMYLGARRIRVVPDIVYEYRVRETRDGLMDHLFDRPSNYGDHLQLAAFVADLARAEPPDRRRWLERFVARQSLPFVERAAGFLDDRQLAALAPLVHEAFGDVDPQILERFSRQPSRRRAAAAAICGGPLPDPRSPVAVEPVGGAWHLADLHGVPSELRTVPDLTWRALRASLGPDGLRLQLALTDRRGERVLPRFDQATITAGEAEQPLAEASDGVWTSVLPVTPRSTGPLRVAVSGRGGSVSGEVRAGHLGLRRLGNSLVSFGDGRLDVTSPSRPATFARRVGELLRRRLTTRG